MNIVSCVLRRNSPEIRRKLDNLGICKNPFDLEIEKVDKWLIIHAGIYMSIEPYKEIPKTYIEVIDCGDNEKLFFAIINYDEFSDEAQLFKFSDGSVSTCLKSTQGIMWGPQGTCGFTREKMTLEEIIIHFS